MNENPNMRVVRTQEEDLDKLVAEAEGMRQHNSNYDTSTDKDYLGIMPYSNADIQEIENKANALKVIIESNIEKPTEGEQMSVAM